MVHELSLFSGGPVYQDIRDYPAFSEDPEAGGAVHPDLDVAHDRSRGTRRHGAAPMDEVVDIDQSLTKSLHMIPQRRMLPLTFSLGCWTPVNLLELPGS